MENTPAPLRPSETADGNVDPGRLRRARRASGAAILWERLWPALMPLVMVVALFLAVSFLGVWPLLADWARYLALGVFAAAAIWAIRPLLSLSLRLRAGEVDARIERASQLSHRPVTAQDDARVELGADDSDPFTRALWAEHRRRASAQLGPLRSGKPVPAVAARDPYALRALAVLALFIGAVAGWGEYGPRVADAFRSQQVAAVADAGRIDAWVTPPAYTNRPPITLTRGGANDESRTAVSVPEGSEFVMRVVGVDAPGAVVGGEVLEPTAPEDGKAAVGSTSFTATLNANGEAELRSGEDVVAVWRFDVIADENPTIAFEGEPTTATRGALEFAYHVGDDYGVSSARGIVTAVLLPENFTAGRTPRPLVEAPEIALSLPKRNAREGTSKISRDLTAHAWAGAEVELTLEAKDQAGQTGTSAPQRFTLPERVFTKPLARAVVYERRRLALDANTARRVARMLDIITDTRPDIFIPDAATYMGLRVAQKMIARAPEDDIETGDAVLRDAMDLLWDIALQVEDGDLSAAERRLRDAQERLAEALENGASDEEIEKLMNELRQAMSEFMQQMAEQMAKQPQQQAMPMDPNAQVLRQQDIDRMMQQIEDLAKSGSKDAARQLLQELQQMMNNLQTAQPQQQQQNGQQDEFSQQMNKLGEMMRQQQQLMDETFQMQRQQQQQRNRQQQGGQQNQQQQQGQQQQGQQQQGQQGEQGQNGEQRPMTQQELADALEQLRKRQGELQQQMQDMQQALREQGLDPGKLGEAGEAMGEAEGELGQGETGPATGQQGRALQAMRDGAQQMMQAMQNQAGEQGRRGERGQHGEQTRGERDPLGRQSRSRGPQLGDDTKVPDEIDAQRAREILDAIRKRLGENLRPRLELDYLDRLLPTR